MANIIYQPTALVGTTKKGKLRCDPDGYYDICVGGFDVFNSARAYYPFASARSHFDASHDFQRRIANGSLYGENGHPVYVPGTSKRDWLLRVLTIDPTRKSHHIRELELNDTVFKNDDGSPMVAVFARLKPAGPYAQALGDCLDNENENTAFSIRSITNDHVDPRTGTVIKEMQAIATYDWVVEPGISKATKFNTPSLESYGETSIFTERDIESAILHATDIYGGFEDNGIISTLETLRKPAPKLVLPTPTWHKWF